MAGLVRNRRLGRAIADQGFVRARRMLGYKTTWNGALAGKTGTAAGQPAAANHELTYAH